MIIIFIVSILYLKPATFHLKMVDTVLESSLETETGNIIKIHILTTINPKFGLGQIYLKKINILYKNRLEKMPSLAKTKQHMFWLGQTKSKKWI